jgi:beta-lactamase regulating signal transducer with metallopeptidase domain
MLDFLGYTLEAGVIFAILTIIYRQVYYGISYNKWERSYLLMAPIVSYLLPLCKLKYFVHQNPRPDDKIVEIMSEDNGLYTVALNRERTVSIDISNFMQTEFFEMLTTVIFAIYIAGVVVKLVSMWRGISKTIALKKCSPCEVRENVSIYNTDLPVIAFSYFGSIFLGNKATSLSDNDRNIIIEHEMQHVKGCHSADKFLYGLFSAVQWCNPMVKIAASYSRIVCENIADSGVVEGGELSEYTQLILRIGTQKRSIALSGTNRRQSGLVERIARLFCSDSGKVMRIRFVAALPILAIAISAYILLWGMWTPYDTRYQLPIDGKCSISAGYFENQNLCTPDGEIIVVSHRQIDISIGRDGCTIIAPFDCKIVSVDNSQITVCNNTITLTVGGVNVYKDFSEQQELLQGSRVGDASPESLVYIKVLSTKGTPENPQRYFKF